MAESITLYFRFGEAVKNPTQQDMEKALAEVFGSLPSCVSQSDAQEHPNCWMEIGYDSEVGWTTITHDVYANGMVYFSKYADQDDSEPEYEYKKNRLSAAEILNQWILLTQNQCDLIREFFIS